MYNDYYNYGNDLGSGLAGVMSWILIIALTFLGIFLAILVFQLIAQWKVYKKAGKGGWEAIVPFYCNWVLVEIAGLKWYWFLFFFAPTVFSFIELEVIGWLVYLFGTFNIFYNLSKKFNKGTGFAVCLTLFTPICMAILGFSKKNIYDANIPVSENGVFGTPAVNTDNSQNEYQQTVQQNNINTENLMHETTMETTVNSSSVPKFCTECGSALLQDAKFCTNCGKQI